MNSILPKLCVICLTYSKKKVGPIVVSDVARSAELEVSLLERLFERPLYSSYANILNGQEAVASYLSQRVGLPFTNLVKVCVSSWTSLTPFDQALTDGMVVEL